MADLNEILSQLRAERARLDAAIRAIEQIDGRAPLSIRSPKKKRRLSAAGRARIVAAAKARWAAARKAKKGKRA